MNPRLFFCVLDFCCLLLFSVQPTSLIDHRLINRPTDRLTFNSILRKIKANKQQKLIRLKWVYYVLLYFLYLVCSFCLRATLNENEWFIIHFIYPSHRLIFVISVLSFDFETERCFLLLLFLFKGIPLVFGCSNSDSNQNSGNTNKIIAVNLKTFCPKCDNNVYLSILITGSQTKYKRECFNDYSLRFSVKAPIYGVAC